LLQQAIDAGQLPRDTDTSLATHALHSFMSGLMREWVLEKDVYDLAAVAPSLVDMTLAGLRNNPPRRPSRVRPRVRPRSCSAT
jgi:TetR/AcrR family acrAB operon transcriptional repressor